MFKLIFSFLCLCSLLFSSLQGEENFIQMPPKGWECIKDATQLPQKIKIIYIGKGSSNNPFNPSLNVACEETKLSINDYIKTAKTYHEGQRDTHCTFLGRINTVSGPAEVLQIDRASQWGAIRFVQAMLINNGQAYVVTATCLKNDFSSLSSQIFKAIQSLNIR